MQLARNHFLADAAFAAQQHADVAVGDALDHAHHVLHGGARTPRRLDPVRILGHLRAEALDFSAERLALERIANGRLEGGFADAFRITRLEYIVSRVETDRFDNGGGSLTARQHDYLCGG